MSKVGRKPGRSHYDKNMFDLLKKIRETRTHCFKCGKNEPMEGLRVCSECVSPQKLQEMENERLRKEERKNKRKSDEAV